MVPGVIPVRKPVKGPIVATEGLLLVHVPPVMPSLSVMLAPLHTESGPAIGSGTGFTVTVTVPDFVHPKEVVAVTV